MYTKEYHSLKLGPSVYVTDPCYEPGTYGQLVLSVLPGEWEVELVLRKHDLRVMRQTYTHTVGVKHIAAEDVVAFIGVDSGQAGVFDADIYPDVCRDKDWYVNVCRMTGEACRCGTLKSEKDTYNYGFVSSTGYGDNSYRVSISRDANDNVVGINLVFIDEDEETNG